MIQRLLNHLDNSSCNFLAVETIKKVLDEKGFQRLNPALHWEIRPGGKYYVTKNDTAVMAFIAGQDNPALAGFRIISAHSDSPCFKIKPNAEIYGDGGVVKLNVEKYGGGILYTWFDRPLSISGRVMTAGEDALHPVTHILDLKRPVAFIPHLAIHFNRAVNEGNPLSVQKDMLPVVGYFSDEEIDNQKANGGIIKMILAEHLGIATDDILEYELCLYPFEKAALAGVRNEYFQSARIDDLSMAFAALEAITDEKVMSTAGTTPATRIMAIFDNEETGSGTKQGAHAPFLKSIMDRICNSYPDAADDSLFRAVAQSFMISADDAHGWHPNYNEKYDPTNHPVLGGGPVIKINANCKYMTDADGAAVMKALCRRAGVPCQYFVNHSDVAGGSTLGNILTSQLDLRGVDMGNAIWAMHSARETGAVADQEATVALFKEFFK